MVTEESKSFLDRCRATLLKGWGSSLLLTCPEASVCVMMISSMIKAIDATACAKSSISVPHLLMLHSPLVQTLSQKMTEGQKWEELPISSIPMPQFSQFASCFSRFLYQYWGFCLCDCGSKQDRVQCWIRKWIQNCSITGLQCFNYGNANFLYTRQLDLYLNKTITTSDDHRSKWFSHNRLLAVLLTTEMPVFLCTRQLDLYLNKTITTSDDHRSNRVRHNLLPTSSSCKLLFSVYYNNCRSRNSHCLKTDRHTDRHATTNWAQLHTYPRIEPFDSTIEMRLVWGTKVSVPEQHWKAIIKRETEQSRAKHVFTVALMQVEAHAKFREWQLRTTRGICTLYQCRYEIFRRERREGSKRQEKERKEKPKKAFRTSTFWRERDSARHILKGSTPWNQILGPNIRRIFFSFLARIRLFPMYR